MIFDRLRRFGLGTRIAFTILAAIVLIQALNVAAFVLLPRPAEKIYSAHWLAERSAEAAALFKLPAAERRREAKALSDAHGLTILSIPEADHRHVLEPQPLPDSVEPVSLQLLKAVIMVRLGAASGVTVKVERKRPPPQFALSPLALDGPAPPTMIPDTFKPEPLSPDALAANADRPVWGHFCITLANAADDWILILPEHPPALAWLLSPHVITGLLAIVLVTLLSAWTAKRSLAPLEHLADAARRMGRERVPSPVETRDLGDFAVVGEALNEMQSKVRTFIDDRTQMLGAISHDMRTGLTRLRLSAEEVPDGSGKSTLIAAIEDMDQMITATLTFAGDDLSGEPSTQVDVAAIVITCCDTLQDLGGAITYEGANHASAVCQPTSLKRAVMNVAENAVKYGHEAHLTLTAEADRILIRVLDKGPGIPDHLIPEALRPFRRLETSRSRETGGAGLGLAIARDVMSAHGGSLRLENHPGGGLLATLDLPRSSLAQGS